MHFAEITSSSSLENRLRYLSKLSRDSVVNGDQFAGRWGRCLQGRLESGGGGPVGNQGGGGGEQTSPLELVTSDRSFISLPPSSQQPASAPQTQARCCSTNTHTHTTSYCTRAHIPTVYTHTKRLCTHTVSYCIHTHATFQRVNGKAHQTHFMILLILPGACVLLAVAIPALLS